MNNCLCIKHDLRSITINSLPPLHCKYKCENNADDAYLADCGGEDAYNIYETQEGIIYIFWCTCVIQRLYIAIRNCLLNSVFLSDVSWLKWKKMP